MRVFSTRRDGAWNGLDTSIALTAGARQFAVVAIDAAGRQIGRSAPVTIQN